MTMIHGIHRIRFSLLGCLITFLTYFSPQSFAQKSINVDLIDLLRKNKLDVINRDVTVHQEGAKRFLKVEKQLRPNQVPGKSESGVIWLPVKDFSEGSIELVARGRDILQGSFIGVAFHAVNDSTFDNVYCRPFNFVASDPVRKIHAVQYAYQPKYDWQKLRTEQNGKYEKGIANPPKANDWFTLTVQVEGETVKAFINHEKTPTLVVKKLNSTKTGKIGITGMNFDIKSFQIVY